MTDFLYTGPTPAERGGAELAVGLNRMQDGGQDITQNSKGPNTCCFCWCCCCSCSWNEAERQRKRKRQGTKMETIPKCEPCPRPSGDEIRLWSQSFDKLLRSPAGRGVFREFLRTEYSEENLQFWLACEDLKQEVSRRRVEEKARSIYEDYVSVLSPREVSLDARVREAIVRTLQEPTPLTFEDAQLQIYTLMHRDSYPRFLSSSFYRSLVHGTASQC